MAGAAPILLLSMPQMMDPNFAKTVVLLTDYTDEGAFGLVVNRQMEEPAWMLVKTEPPNRVDVDPALIFNTPPNQMWEAAIRRLGADPAGLQIASGGIH